MSSPMDNVHGNFYIAETYVIILPHSYYGFRIIDVGSRLMAFQ
jgi:hypothetical protein